MPNLRLNRYPIIQLGETCGIEFEVENIQPGDNISTNFNQTHDASIETDRAVVGNLILLDAKKDDPIFKIIPYRTIVTGTELVSKILGSSEPDFLDIIKQVTNVLIENGECPHSERCGIHFHFSLPNPNLRILKSILRLGKYLEALFFTIGCMGYEFRGIKNDSIYCRPITKFGPVCVTNGAGNYVQCYNIYDLLKSTTIDEFWEKYGDLESHTGRYNPVRYSWLNLYQLYPYAESSKGTLEFRIFNKTLNPEFIYGAAMLCKAFTNYAVKSSYNSLDEDDLLHENSIYNEKITKIDILTQLAYFSELSGLSDSVRYILTKIINTSEVPILPKTFVHTHLKRGLNPYWGNGNYVSQVIDRTLIKNPNYVDIHVLRGEV